MITFPSPTSSRLTTAGRPQYTASTRPDTKEKQKAIDALKDDPVENVISWHFNAQINDGCEKSPAPRPTLKSIANSSSDPSYSAEIGVDLFTGTSQYSGGDSDVALRMPVPYVHSRPSTSSTISPPPNMANVSARSSSTDQSALFAGLPESSCTPLGSNWPRVSITDANFPQSSEPSHESIRSGETSKCPPNACSGKSKVKKEQKFACIYCERAFSQRHDFKRHFKDSHESDVVYVCDSPNCSKKFFLAYKFTTHHQKSHRCGESNGERCRHAEECKRPNSEQRARRGCGACLHYSVTLDEWLDHIADHYKNGFKKKDWNDALVFSSLLSQPEIVEAWSKLTSDPFPVAGWSTDHRERLQFKMERNVLTAGELAQDIFDTLFDHTKSNTAQPVSHVQPAEDDLQFAPATVIAGIPSFTPRSHNLLSPLNDQSITMTLPQTGYSANQAFNMPQYAEDDMAFGAPLSQYHGYTNIEYVRPALGHPYARTTHEPHQTEASTEQQYHPIPFSYLGPQSVVANPNHFQLYPNNTTPHSITYPHGPSTEKASTLRRLEKNR